MKFVDQVKVFVKAGDGGHGCLSFRREKFIEFGGPDGGCGGNGGSIIFRGDQNANTLIKYRFCPHIKAENGEHGSGRNKIGESAKDLICKVPKGTQIIDENNNILFDITKDKQEYCIAKGGRGGRGNATFKNSKDRAPRSYTQGETTQEMVVILKLKVLADIGLVGFPNAGKSTFLSICSNAKPKIANYPFSTLSPNLGIVKIYDETIVMADIPGIIENAHKGAGLGHKFLNHIERCKILLYLIDVGTADICSAYTTLQNELLLHKKDLKNKKHAIILTKCDLHSTELISTKKAKLEDNFDKQVIISGLNENTMQVLGKIKSLYDKSSPKKTAIKFDPLL